MEGGQRRKLDQTPGAGSGLDAGSSEAFEVKHERREIHFKPVRAYAVSSSICPSVSSASLLAARQIHITQPRLALPQGLGLQIIRASGITALRAFALLCCPFINTPEG